MGTRWTWSVLAAWMLLAGCERKDPKLPPANPTSLPAQQTVQGLVGKMASDPAVQALLSELGEPPRETRFETTYYLIARKKGLSLLFNARTNVLRAAIVYPEGAEGFNRYAGPVPHGLSVDMTRQQVEDLLGLPDRIEGGDKDRVSVIYQLKNVKIVYDSKAPQDRTARIWYIALM